MANPRALLICMMIICRGSCPLAGRTIMMMIVIMMIVIMMIVMMMMMMVMVID